jgi:(p)ppGpp synthase/HD superfamily hydrolase
MRSPQIAGNECSRRACVRDTHLVSTAELPQVNPSFTRELPLTRAALQFALERHAGQLRADERVPFVQHPLEVASLLRLAGYRDDVVASGVLHDVLENTHTDEGELEDRFGKTVAALVQAVSEDTSIEDERVRKSGLRAQVARSSTDAAAVFAADKVSKAREMRSRLGRGLPREEAAPKLNHYRLSLPMLERRLGRRHPLIEQLRFELDLLETT